MTKADASAHMDVLIVGAGPTGLALAGELRALGVTFRIIDRAPDAVHESRALAIQARTLEVLARGGSAEALIEAGDSATTLLMHSGRDTTAVKLFEESFDETEYPFLLFLSQAKTERILVEQLAESGVEVERGLTLLGLVQDDAGVTCAVAAADGATLELRAGYVVGCDGAHSATRRTSGIGFAGTAFPQTFVIADLEADGLEPGRVHAYLDEQGMMFFFPLGSPATWRMLVMVPSDKSVDDRDLESLQSIVAAYSRDRVFLRDPVWMTDFTIQSRRADRFREGRVFLAGDAAHIHSPAGGQGMNTGIQDAVNLGWKLAVVCRGLARQDLLDSYERERLPVARSVLRMTDRAFRVATSSNPVLRFFRPRAAAAIVPVVFRLGVVRRLGFRAVSELGINYRRGPLSIEGRPRLRFGPRAGDRLPHARISVDGVQTTLQRSVSPTAFQLLLCGPAERWSEARIREFMGRWSELVRVSPVTTGEALKRLGLSPHASAQYLVRPDGYIGYRSGGTELQGLEEYLRGALRTSL